MTNEDIAHTIFDALTKTNYAQRESESLDDEAHFALCDFIRALRDKLSLGAETCASAEQKALLAAIVYQLDAFDY